MFLFVLLLLVCSTQATHFFGTVMTYYPKGTDADGFLTVGIRYKLNFHQCTYSDTWTCFSGNCGIVSVEINKVKEESNGEWCQTEGITTRTVPTDDLFQLQLNGGNWISGIINGISAWRAITTVELRTRSDIGKANTSPQTTILPAVSVPSNCPREFSLLAFDPDGDVVKCRNGDELLSECNPCTPPSALSISSSCTLSFSPNSSSIVGPYAVQLMMEDFPRHIITLTNTNGTQEVKTPSDAISKIPVQFVVRVDPPVPSCTEGLFLPKFLPPTPANGARLYVPVNKLLNITISAEAKNATISELLYSGPHNLIQNRTGPGEFTLTWTPAEREDGESHPICFVVQALLGATKYHSELRCIIVGNVTELIPPDTTPPTTPPTTILPDSTPAYVARLKMKISSLVDLSLIDQDIFINLVKGVLESKGLPSGTTLRLRSSKPQIGAT